MKSGVSPTFAEQRIMRTNGNSDSIYFKKIYSNLNRSFQEISRTELEMTSQICIILLCLAYVNAYPQFGFPRK